MNYRDWYAGMKLVCIAAPWEGHRPYGDEITPEVGRVYTLREIIPDDFDGKMVVLLDEVRNKTRRYQAKNGLVYRTEPAFDAACFRPTQARMTDISVFTAMLTGAKERERA